VRERERHVLPAPRHGRAESRHQRETRAGERVGQPSIAQAVPARQDRAARERLIDSQVSLIDVVAKRWRRHVIRKGLIAIRQRIQGSDVVTDGTLEK
jgi:hypothetical protein